MDVMYGRWVVLLPYTSHPNSVPSPPTQTNGLTYLRVLGEREGLVGEIGALEGLGEVVVPRVRCQRLDGLLLWGWVGVDRGSVLYCSNKNKHTSLQTRSKRRHAPRRSASWPASLAVGGTPPWPATAAWPVLWLYCAKGRAFKIMGG